MQNIPSVDRVMFATELPIDPLSIAHREEYITNKIQYIKDTIQQIKRDLPSQRVSASNVTIIQSRIAEYSNSA